MVKFYCHPIKKYISFLSIFINGYYEVLLIASSTGVVLDSISLPVSTGRIYCCYINSKKYSWLYHFLIDNDIAKPTHRVFICDGFSFPEFKFNKEV